MMKIKKNDVTETGMVLFYVVTVGEDFWEEVTYAQRIMRRIRFPHKRRAQKVIGIRLIFFEKQKAHVSGL